MNSIDEFVKQFREVETELIKLIFRKVSEGKGISYLAGQLAYLVGLKDVDRLVEAISISEEAVERLLRKELPDLEIPIKAYQQGATNIDPLVFRSTFERILFVKGNDLQKGLAVIRTKVKSAVRKEYVNVLTKAYIESMSGAYSYDEAVRRAVRDLSDRGIKIAQYQTQEGKTINYNIESAVRRTLLTEIGDTSNQLQMAVIDELDSELVYVSQHLGARVTKRLDYTNHAWWQGAVYKRFGNSRYEDFYQKTGYGKIEGLKGINCRHYIYPYFEGISPEPPPRIPIGANREVYDLQQEYNRLSRSYDKFKRRYDVLGEEKDRLKMREYSKRRVVVRQGLEGIKQHYARIGIV